jgi:DNA modification methylase
MINFHNIDCIQFMASKPDKFYKLAIVDPPYGIVEVKILE